jgi:hypothetical protein
MKRKLAVLGWAMFVLLSIVVVRSMLGSQPNSAAVVVPVRAHEQIQAVGTADATTTATAILLSSSGDYLSLTLIVPWQRKRSHFNRAILNSAKLRSF